MMEIKTYSMEQTINVVDDICGSGKTSWAIQEINDSINRNKKLAFGEALEQEKFVYVTPYLKEIERVRESVEIDFVEPDVINGKGSKLKHFQALIQLGKSIVTTHQLFKKLDVETLNLIEEMGYTLIMDEVANVLEQYDITKSDIELLIANKTIRIGKKHKVEWLNADYSGKFSDMKILAESDNLILQNGSAMFWTMNTRAFEAFEKVFILTYLFDGQTQCSYYQANDIRFQKLSVNNVNGRYGLIEYNNTLENRKAIYELLNIYEDPTGNDKKSPLNSNFEYRQKIKTGDTALSTTWFNNAPDEAIKQLSKNLQNYFRTVVPTENEKLFWTTVKIHAPKLKNAKTKYNAKGLREKDNFLSINARATNKYKNRTTMAYVYNRFINPMERNFFAEYEVNVNEDALAVSDLIQFMFRGCIRDGEPMNCYIPSTRMRKLLKDWSEYKI